MPETADINDQQSVNIVGLLDRLPTEQRRVLRHVGVERCRAASVGLEGTFDGFWPDAEYDDVLTGRRDVLLLFHVL